MSDKKYGFSWVLRLPDLDAATKAKYEAVRTLADEAAELEEQAQRLKERAAEVRGEAYRKCLHLESHVRGIWSAATVDRLKNNF
ncbi:TPA: stable inheritance protein KleA [Pseudomonas aeruginosa]|nr:stable inheritance protein KleA [Pseudomonas aeruginosa]